MVQPVQTQIPTLPRFVTNFGFVLRAASQSLAKCSTELLPDVWHEWKHEGTVVEGPPKTSPSRCRPENEGEGRGGKKNNLSFLLKP